MTGTPTIRTESLGGSPLSRAARAGALPQWYRPIPKDAAEWQTYASAVQQSVAPGWFSDLSGAIAPKGMAAARLERSAGGKGIVVTTGQQPGLFGGPLMTLIKAISARALADELEARLGMPVAPLFWAATDDADFDEAAAVSVALDGGARELRLERRAPPGTPMARVPLDGDVDALAAVLRDACGSAPHRSMLQCALDAYHDGATVGDAYVTLLRQILEPLEVAVLDASHPSVSAAAAPLLRTAATSADALAAAVRARNDEIVAAGYAPQVDEVAALSLVFLNDSSGKRRSPLREAAGLGALDGHQFLSSTVLLRPVVERAILPTAAYVGGPGEVAYFAQVTAVASALNVPQPLVVPRWSATILEPSILHSLDELGLDLDALADPHAADSRLAAEGMPPGVTAAIASLRAHIDADVDALVAADETLVPAAALDGLRRAMAHRVDRAERRLLAGVKRRDADVMRRLATLRGAVYPHGVRQERKLAYIPLLARHGPPILHALLDAARAHARGIVARDTIKLERSAATAPA